MIYPTVNAANGNTLKRLKEITERQMGIEFDTFVAGLQMWRHMTLSEAVPCVRQSHGHFLRMDGEFRPARPDYHGLTIHFGLDVKPV
jgi:hypothetical protein